jgi:cytochrome c1
MPDFHCSLMRVKSWIAGRARLRVSLLTAFLVSITAVGCGQNSEPAASVTGNAQKGAVTITQMGCGSCHSIPGIADADGMVGPPLTHFQRRTIIAGLLPNTPDNLVHWIRHPQSVVPGNAMPDTGLSEKQARDVAAYLYTLR